MSGTPLAGAAERQAWVLEAVRADPVCEELLHRLPSLGLPQGHLTAGAVFQNVWNHITGRPAGHGIRDYDVFYFDDADLSWEAEDRVIRAVGALTSDLHASVEVRNEARVHLWYAEHFGTVIPAFRSARDAIDAFFAPACSLGIPLLPGATDVYAPYGFADVFDLVLRPNPRVAPRGVYEEKSAEYASRWPELRVLPWSDATAPTPSRGAEQ